MKRNMREWVAGIIAGKERQVIPIMTYPGLYFTGKTIPDLITNGEEHYKCIKALADHYPTAASVSVMDLSLESQAFGADIIVSDDDVPTIKGSLLKDSSGIASLQVPKVGAGRTGEYIKAATLASENITNKPVFAGIIGPFSLAGRLSDMSEFMINVMIDPGTSHELIKKCNSFLKEYAMAYKKAGCNGLVIAEPAAGLLSSETCHEFSSAYVKQIVDYVQDENFIVILHNCGKTTELVPSMVSTGAAGFHFGNAVDMTDIMPQIPADRFACGNVEPSGMFRSGNPELMKKTVKELLNKTRSYKNFILSSGCDIPPKTPKENVDAFFEALREYNSGK